jgi:hypothetical protein
MKRIAVLRLVYFSDEHHGDGAPLMFECLRYMGLVTYQERGVPVSGDGPRYRYVVDFHCPHGHDRDVWMRQNVERMRSFGLCVAAVWKDSPVVPQDVADAVKDNRILV